MARVNVEERCFSEARLRHFASLMNWTEREALGCLAFLWRDSQDLLKTHGTEQEIGIWSRLTPHEVAGGLQAMLVASLCQAGYLTEEKEGFLIRGNERQIDSRVKMMSRAKKGGLATKKRWSDIKKQARADNQSKSPTKLGMPQAMPQASLAANSNLAQFKAMQGNARQGNAGHGIAHPEPTGSPPADAGKRAPKKRDHNNDPADEALASRWAEYAKSVSNTVKPNIHVWASTVRKMREIDGYDIDTLSAALAFAERDEFWSKNAVSLPALRNRSKNDVLKIENLVKAMRHRSRHVSPAAAADQPAKRLPMVLSADEVEAIENER